MATKLGSNNVFPKLIISEGTTPAAPSAGQQKLFIDSADHHLKRENSSGVVTDIEGSGAPTSAQYVTLATDATLTNERVLTAGKNVSITDAGAGSTVTVAVTVAATDDGNSGTSKTIDFNSRYRDTHILTLTGNVTLTLSNPVDGGCYAILLKTGAGSFTVTWPASVLWPAGSAPTITTTASKVDLVTLIYDSAAGKYYGSFNQNY